MDRERPREVIVWYRGTSFVLDLVRCRRALVQRQVEGELDNMNSLARKVGVSRSTASRFFSGRSTSLAVTLRVLAVLHLTFEDVARPVTLAGWRGYLVAMEPATDGRVIATNLDEPECRATGATNEEALEAIKVEIDKLQPGDRPRVYLGAIDG
jgi:transcriptional regulator with XRE-family HTH domain